MEELEEALRESVRITAQREMVVHDLEVKVRQAELKVSVNTHTHIMLKGIIKTLGHTDFSRSQKTEGGC